MAKATRVGDSTTGVCNPGACDNCPHGRTGSNSGGSPDVFINGRKCHRLGDSISISCPHGGAGHSVAGSKTVFCNGKPVTRISDTTICDSCGQSGSHVSGSPNVFVG